MLDLSPLAALRLREGGQRLRHHNLRDPRHWRVQLRPGLARPRLRGHGQLLHGEH